MYDSTPLCRLDGSGPADGGGTADSTRDGRAPTGGLLNPGKNGARHAASRAEPLDAVSPRYAVPRKAVVFVAASLFARQLLCQNPRRNGSPAIRSRNRSGFSTCTRRVSAGNRRTHAPAPDPSIFRWCGSLLPGGTQRSGATPPFQDFRISNRKLACSAGLTRLSFRSMRPSAAMMNVERSVASPPSASPPPPSANHNP